MLLVLLTYFYPSVVLIPVHQMFSLAKPIAYEKHVSGFVCALQSVAVASH